MTKTGSKQCSNASPLESTAYGQAGEAAEAYAPVIPATQEVSLDTLKPAVQGQPDLTHAYTLVVKGSRICSSAAEHWPVIHVWERRGWEVSH